MRIICCTKCFFFNDTATTEIYTLSLHDALPISLRNVVSKYPDRGSGASDFDRQSRGGTNARLAPNRAAGRHRRRRPGRSEEHTSELQSRQYLVCRLLLEKKQDYTASNTHSSTVF